MENKEFKFSSLSTTTQTEDGATITCEAKDEQDNATIISIHFTLEEINAVINHLKNYVK